MITRLIRITSFTRTLTPLEPSRWSMSFCTEYVYVTNYRHIAHLIIFNTSIWLLLFDMNIATQVENAMVPFKERRVFFYLIYTTTTLYIANIKGALWLFLHQVLWPFIVHICCLDYCQWCTKWAKGSNYYCGVIKSGRFGYKKISSLVWCNQSSVRDNFSNTHRTIPSHHTHWLHWYFRWWMTIAWFVCHSLFIIIIQGLDSFSNWIQSVPF